MLKEILALALRKLSKHGRVVEVDREDLKLVLMFELGISSSVVLEQLLRRAVEEGLLEEHEGKLVPKFDYLEVEVPLNIQQCLAELLEEKPLEERILERVAQVTGKPVEELREELERLRSEYSIFYPEVLAVYLAMKYNVEIYEYLEMVKNRIKERF